MSLENNKKNLYWDIGFGVLFILTALFLIYKCRYGIGSIDESFYLNVPYRLVQGDGLLSQEWHLSQLSGFLLYPLMKIYLMISGSMDGMILTFRYIYTGVQLALGLFVFFKFRKINRPGAIAAAICIMVFAPYGIMALSYNSMGIICLTVCLTLLAAPRRAVRLQQAAAGVFFAAGVLCCPYLLFLFVFYFIAAVIGSALKKKRTIDINSPYYLKSFLFFLIGAAAVAVVFGTFVLSRSSFKEILAALPNIMNDAEHEFVGVLEIFLSYFKEIFSIGKFVNICYGAMLVLIAVSAIDRKRKDHGWLYFILASCVSILAMYFMYRQGNFINYLMFPVNLMAVECALLSRNDLIKKIFAVFWIPGMLYTFCINVSSNQGFYAISMAAAVPLAASLIITGMTAAALLNNRRGVVKAALILAACAVLVCQVGSVAYKRYRSVFRESLDILSKEAETRSIDKGLYMSEEHAEIYEHTLEITEYINEKYVDCETIAFVSGYVWMYYMCAEKKMGSFSAWMLGVYDGITPAVMEKQMEYYRLNEDKIPDIVYIVAEYDDYASYYENLADYETEYVNDGGMILVRE